jgi:hypothetical protein
MVFRSVLGGVLQLGFNFGNSDAEAPLNFGNAGAIAEVSGLIEVLEISAKLRQQFFRGPMNHRKKLLHGFLGKCVNSFPQNPSWALGSSDAVPFFAMISLRFFKAASILAMRRSIRRLSSTAPGVRSSSRCSSSMRRRWSRNVPERSS